jgi:iron(III) transport system substrate-binding protein
LVAIATTAVGITQVGATEVNVYSYRESQRIAPLVRAFHAATGIRVKVTFASKDLIDRIAAEGEHGPADVLLTNEFGLLLDARARGLTHPFKSPIVEANIPAIYRDPDGHWFGLTRRARVLVVSVERVDAQAITYEELADPRWRGKICIRSGTHLTTPRSSPQCWHTTGRRRRRLGCGGSRPIWRVRRPVAIGIRCAPSWKGSATLRS